MLNSSLGFDMMSLLNGFKSPDFGLLNSSIDYQNYYTCERLNYSNDYIDGGEKSNQINANTNIYDLMPRIKMLRVLEQIFKDINLIFNLNDSLLNDETIFIPYTGEEDPIWNWKHLASLEVQGDFASYNSYGNGVIISTEYFETYAADYNNNGNIIRGRRPVIVSRDLYSSIGATNTLNSGLNSYPKTTNNISNTYKLYSNYKTQNEYPNSSNNFQLRVERKSGINDICNALHYIPTPKVLKDPNNNFNMNSDSIVNREIYICPISGEYEFELNVNHQIRIFTNDFDKVDYLKQNIGNVAGYNDIEYKANERMYMQNAVMIVKYDESSIDNFFGVDDTLNLNADNPQPTNDVNDVFKWKNCKMLTNFQDENVIAFYHPMLRDLYKNDFNEQSIEQFFINENSILKNNQTYPADQESRNKYYGFNLDTKILNYENKITSYAGNSNIEHSKKLVKLNLSGKKGQNHKNISYQYNVLNEYLANGEVKFKFKTKLAKGDQIKLIYFTRNTVNDYGVRLNTTVNYPVCSENQGHVYSDLYTDDINVNSYKINIMGEKYSDKLKLANFLPNIKQKDFILDWIKTNNLFFDIKDNTITFQKRNNFYKDKAKKDLTKNVSIDSILIEPNRIFETTKFGYKFSEEDDLRESIDLTNPTYEYKLDSNIYTEKSILDNRSIIFNSTGLRSFEYYKNNDATNINTIPQIITIPNLTEGNTINKLNDLTLFDGGFKTSNRLLKSSGNFLDLTSIALSIKINGITFFQNSSKRFDGVPNLNIGLPILYDSNETLFNTLFNDKFINLIDTSLITFEMYLTPLEYSQLNLNEPVKIQNTLYYIQSVEGYNVLKNNLCKVKLMKF